MRGEGYFSYSASDCCRRSLHKDLCRGFTQMNTDMKSQEHYAINHLGSSFVSALRYSA